MQAIVNVRLFNKPHAIFYIFDDYLVLEKDDSCRRLKSPGGDTGLPKKEVVDKKSILKFVVNAYFLQYFLKECLNSEVYRSFVLMTLHKKCGYPGSRVVCLNLILEPPDKEIIDYAWNERLSRIIWTKVEIENAFSWLSTLGGAYSALGDYFEHCAEEAGRISVRQYQLSKLLGDEGLAARSRLYTAMSFSQKGKLKLARHIVRSVAEYGIQTHDKHLVCMCQGVWAKLKYLRSLKRKQGNGDCNEIDKVK